MRLEPASQVESAPVFLRPLEYTDIADWYAYLSIPAVLEHTSWVVRSQDDLSAIVDRCTSDVAGSSVRFAIVDRSDGSFIGTIGFPMLSWLNRTAEVAYDLRPSASGRGIATACCRAITEWALGDQGFVRVQATALDANAASIRVIEKSGFTFEGKLRHLKMVRGMPRDFLLFSRTKTA
jgi:ribosomal-protein-alanine N-acetyltransferase